jgi:plastocyanin
MRRAFIAAAVIASLGLTALPAHAAVQVKIQDFLFTPSKLAVAEGTAITWHYDTGGTTHHTSTQNGPLALWNTGFLFPGQTSSPVVLRAAGTYPYHCAVHASMVGVIRVPIRVSPITGTTSTTFTIRLATAKQTGLAYDIQKRKGAGAWRAWKTGVTALLVRFTHRAGGGTWWFRSRVHRISNGARSGWSPARRIAIS